MLRIIILVTLEEDPLNEVMDTVIEEEEEAEVEIRIGESTVSCVVSQTILWIDVIIDLIKISSDHQMQVLADLMVVIRLSLLIILNL